MQPAALPSETRKTRPKIALNGSLKDSTLIPPKAWVWGQVCLAPLDTSRVLCTQNPIMKAPVVC